jgi:hypothetical protein
MALTRSTATLLRASHLPLLHSQHRILLPTTIVPHTSKAFSTSQNVSQKQSHTRKILSATVRRAKQDAKNGTRANIDTFTRDYIRDLHDTKVYQSIKEDLRKKGLSEAQVDDWLLSVLRNALRCIRVLTWCVGIWVVWKVGKWVVGSNEGSNDRNLGAAMDRKLNLEEELRAARKESSGTWDRGSYAGLNGILWHCNS